MRRTVPFLLFGVVATVAAAELALRILPVSTATMTGYYHDPDLLTYPSHHEWQVATGWDLRNARTLKSNNWGFAAAHDFVPDPNAVALIGDSYVEASMLDAADRPAAQLEALLGGQRPVYSLGSPGTALLDHAQRVRLSSERFQVRDVVLLLERFDARQSLCGSGNVHSRCLDRDTLQPRIERMASPGLIKRLARHSALAQYVGSQLKLRPAAFFGAMFRRDTPDSPRAAVPAESAARTHKPERIARTLQVVDAVVESFFSEVAPYLGGRLIVLVDGRREGPPQKPELIDLERGHLIARMRERGAVVHDLEPIYAKHAAVSRRSLSVGPYDGHLNALGVRLAMQVAADSLSQP